MNIRSLREVLYEGRQVLPNGVFHAVNIYLLEDRFLEDDLEEPNNIV